MYESGYAKRVDNYGSNAKKSIQATFEQLKPEQVMKAEIFIAR